MKTFLITFKNGETYELAAHAYDTHGDFLHFYHRYERQVVAYDYPGWIARTFFGAPYRQESGKTRTDYEYKYFFVVAVDEIRTIETVPTEGETP